MPPKRKSPVTKAEDKMEVEAELPKGRRGKATTKEDNAEQDAEPARPKRGRAAKETLPTEAAEEAKPAKTKKGRPKEAVIAEKPEEEVDEEEAEPVKVKKGKPAKEEAAEDDAEDAEEPPKVKRGRAAKEASEPDVVEESAEPTKAKRGRAAKEAPPAEEEDEETVEPVKGRRGRVAKEATNSTENPKPKGGRGAKNGKDGKAAPKPRGRKAGAKPKKSESSDEVDEDEEVEEPKKPQKTKKTKEASEPKKNTKSAEGDAVATDTTNYSKIKFTCAKKNTAGKLSNFKISSWNVSGLRAWTKKDGIAFIENEAPDIICLQETKCSEDQLPNEIKKIEAYNQYWHASDKPGYAGVAILSKVKPISVTYGIDNEMEDTEGRCITAEYEKFYLLCVYVPNAGRKLVTLPKRLEWNTAFEKYIEDLDTKKPVIICGDMNVAHKEVDLANPKTNKKNAGFTQEERDGMSELLEAGFVDTFRHFYPDETSAYTFWTYMSKSRAKNVGWRLDYFIVSERFIGSLCDNVIRHEVFGSDHCPITLFMNV